MGSRPLLRLEDVSCRYGTLAAVDDVSLDVAGGEFFSLLGPSGCGKSTLLRTIAGFVSPSAGRVLIDDADATATPPFARPVNMMFQSYALFPHMSVAANIAFGLKQDRWPRDRIAARVQEMLALLRIEPLAARRPEALSGGQQQRVALARALAKQPKLLLLDEPLSALDRNLREAMQMELLELQRRVGITFVMVTHDQEEAMAMSSRMAVMQAGRIAQMGSPADLYERPASRFVAEFLGAVNLFEGTVEAGGRIGVPKLRASIAAAGALPPAGTAVTIAMRPEWAVLVGDENARPENGFGGTVRALAYRGDTSEMDVDLPGGARLRARVPSGRAASLTAGGSVAVGWPADAVVVLTA